MTHRTAPKAAINVATPMQAPYWALLERQLLDAIASASQAFYEHYFDERGYLLCVPRWGALDGADDAAENVSGFTDAYAIGGSEVLLDLWKHGFEGHIRQYTEAKSTEAEAARDGMYYKEFPTSFDWLHNGEGFHSLFQQGLCEPWDRTFVERMRRFAGFYITDDPAAGAPLVPNYDPKHRIIRSVLNGSRGPILRKGEPADWAGDPFPDGRFTPMRGHRGYDDYVRHFETYLDVVGDVPLNLAATILPLQAYFATGENQYRDWITEYVGAWAERAAANGGVIPGNVTLDGTIGGAFGGKWWLGVGSWGQLVPIIPITPEMLRWLRPRFLYRTHYAFGNALLVTGDQQYVDVWRTMIDTINSNSKEENEQTLYPHAYNDDGWANFRPEPFSDGALHVYYWSMRAGDRDRVASHPWVAFLEGQDAGYPERRLQEALEELRRRMEVVAADTATPDVRLSEDPNALNPAEMVWSLVELMLGGIATRHVGVPWHVCVRYFDPERRRAGIPDGVASLVDHITESEVGLTIVNTDAVHARTLVMQSGAYAEHQIETVTIDNGQRSSNSTPVDGTAITLRLAPGAGARVTLKIKRYVNDPTLAFPWP